MSPANVRSNAPLRVLHVIDTLVAGGAERVLATVVRGLRARGFVIRRLEVSGGFVEPLGRIDPGLAGGQCRLLTSGGERRETKLALAGGGIHGARPRSDTQRTAASHGAVI